MEPGVYLIPCPRALTGLRRFFETRAFKRVIQGYRAYVIWGIGAQAVVGRVSGLAGGSNVYSGAYFHGFVSFS